MIPIRPGQLRIRRFSDNEVYMVLGVPKQNEVIYPGIFSTISTSSVKVLCRSHLLGWHVSNWEVDVVEEELPVA